tara:strand:+ start:959 stop:1837 length:879 start_codon:yes stop_codon:yes gene_type:complete
MENLSNNELSEICKHLGKSNFLNKKQIFGGCIHNSWQIEFNDKRFFLKKNTRKEKLLKFEEYCLNHLAQYINSEILIVPKVLKYFELNNNEYLIMEWLEIDNHSQIKLGQGLAELHLNSHNDNPNLFGYPIQGFIGTTKQLEGWENSWVDCFLKLRIEPQILFLKNNFITTKLINQVKTKIKENLLRHEPMNSLIHGDLWSGNTGSGSQEKGIIFDPSCWWADSEVDIAMTRLFGGFTNDFYNGYYSIIEKKEGFRNRTKIYNFYHILNHANMFGGNYIAQVKQYIYEILNM